MFKRMYMLLFKRITEAIEKLEQGDIACAKAILTCAQQEAEELYIAGNEE